VHRCRQLAAECTQLISITEEWQPETLFEMAKYWLKVADKADRGETLDDESSLALMAGQLKGTFRDSERGAIP
jgi:hypothetical protein